MKLNEIKPLNEYARGQLVTFTPEQVMTEFFGDAAQEKHHIVIKNEGPSAFVYLYKFDANNLMYILVNLKSKQYVGHTTIKRIKPEIFQPIDTFITPEFRGIQLAPRLYSYISKRLNVTIINGTQLSQAAEKMWEKFPNKKIYNKNEDKFYELDKEKIKLVQQDKDRDNQTWFYAWKEIRNVLMEATPSPFNGGEFDYDEFLSGRPGVTLGTRKIHFTPGTPSFLQRGDEYYEEVEAKYFEKKEFTN